ncbi:hypothetical protein [Spiroplasma endosymbiont of Dilophus febrilis]|uniref:hypothetical protein n=1 Tax=Spiroplasma endosymbiont of Dilophus febrilis TaxID=3066292 RepID=UPI00313C3188
MKGKATKPLLISLFLILLLAPGIAFLIVLVNDSLVTTFTNDLNVFTREEYYLQYFQKTYNFSLENTKILLQYLSDFYDFKIISSMNAQLAYTITGTSLVFLGIFIILGGAFFLNKKWKTTRALVVVLLIFWIITIVGFGLLAVGQYKYQWTNEATLNSLVKVKEAKDIIIIPNLYHFASEEFHEFLVALSGKKIHSEAIEWFKNFLFKEFYQKLINLKGNTNDWISEVGIWWVFLIQATLVSLIVAFDYTSYASHLVKPAFVFNKREKILLFGQNWFRKTWVSFKQPTIWNVLRISIFLISIFILIEVILIIANFLNKDLVNLYDLLSKFPYGHNNPRNILEIPGQPQEIIRETFLIEILAPIYYYPNLPTVFVVQFVPILGLTFLIIIWSVSFVLIKRISYLSRGSIILFYTFFLPILFAGLFLFTYSQTNTNNLIAVANDMLYKLKEKYPDFHISYYKSSLFGGAISNTGEWIVFSVEIIVLAVFSIIISILLWKIYQQDNLKIKMTIPNFILEKKKRVKKVKKISKK